MSPQSHSCMKIFEFSQVYDHVKLSEVYQCEFIEKAITKYRP